MSRVKPAQVDFYVDADVLGLARVLARLRSDVTYPGDPGAEIHKRENAHHLAMGKVNDYIVSGEHSAFLLAQSTITRGVMKMTSSRVVVRSRVPPVLQERTPGRSASPRRVHGAPLRS